MMDTKWVNCCTNYNCLLISAPPAKCLDFKISSLFPFSLSFPQYFAFWFPISFPVFLSVCPSPLYPLFHVFPALPLFLSSSYVFFTQHSPRDVALHVQRKLLHQYSSKQAYRNDYLTHVCWAKKNFITGYFLEPENRGLVLHNGVVTRVSVTVWAKIQSEPCILLQEYNNR